MIRVCCLLVCLFVLASCSGGQALKLLTGGGPNVAANVQAGKTNNQTVGVTSNTDQRIVRPQARVIRQSADNSKVQAEAVEQITVHEIPVWIIIAFAVALFLDSPMRWPGQIKTALFSKGEV